MGEEFVAPADLAEKADQYLHETSLTPSDYEALKHSIAELTPIFSADRAYFVLGSYGQPEIRRLQLVKDRLNRRPDAYAFLILIQRGNPALPVRRECSDGQSEPSAEQGGEEARELCATIPVT